MERSFVLRNRAGEFYAGNQPDPLKEYVFTPVFVMPGHGSPVMALVVSQEDIEEIHHELAAANIKVDRVQVG
jgi:hypothetical protein